MVEDEFNLRFIPDRSIKTRAFSFARQVLPEPIKHLIRFSLGREPMDLAKLNPYEAKILKYSALFWVKTANDRNVIANPNYEEVFAPSLIARVAEVRGVFADIGSAQGFYSIIGAKAGADVYAFDPDPRSNIALRENLALNPGISPRVCLIPEALGDIEGEITLNTDNLGKYAPSLKRTQPGLNARVTVPISRLDCLVEDGVLPIPQIVKIDVEGAEGLVIQGMRETLSSPDKPEDLFIELHPEYLSLFGTDLDSVVRSILSFGYKFAEDPQQRGNELQCHFIR